MHKRIEVLKEKLTTYGLGAVFITSPYNISYLSGLFPSNIEERENYLFITKNHSYLLASRMFMLAIKEKTDNFKCIEITFSKGLYKNLSEICVREKIKSIGFEKENLLYKEFELLSKNLKNRELIPLEDFIEEQRQIKDEDEIEKIKAAYKITDETYSYILKNIRMNITERELAWEIENYIKEQGGHLAFSPIVAFGKNSAIPHHIPNGTKLEKNSFVLLDFGAKYEGYCADMSRTVYFGTPNEREINMYNTVLDAQNMALGELKEWKNKDFEASRLHSIAQNHIEKTGFPRIPHSLGHGLGLQVHEPPSISKYTQGNPLRENMVITIEPGIYLPELGGVRIEDDVLLTNSGYEILTKSSKQLTIIK